MRPTLGLAALLVLTVVTAAGRAEAQVVPSPYEFIETTHDLGAYAGIAGEDRGRLGLGPGGGVMIGARYALQLGGPFALEANGALVSTDRDVYEPTLQNGALVHLGNTDALIGVLDGRVRFTLTGDRTWNGLAPYVTIGGGGVTDLRGRSALEEDLANSERFNFGVSLLGVLGAGTRWLPTDNTAVRLEGALNLWRLGTPQAYFELDSSEFPVPEREWAQVTSFVVGFSYRF